MKQPHTWVIGLYAGTDIYKPCRIRKSEAFANGWKMYDSYNECLADCNSKNI